MTTSWKATEPIAQRMLLRMVITPVVDDVAYE